MTESVARGLAHTGERRRRSAAPAEHLPFGERRARARWRRFAALRDTLRRYRVPGLVMLLVGTSSLGTGLLVLDEVFAALMGAGTGIYGLYLCRR